MPKGCGNETQNCAFAILNFFITLQVLLGLTTVASCEYYKGIISKHIGRSEADEIRLQLCFIEIYAVHLIVFYGCGFMISKKFSKEPYTTHLLTLLKIWHIFILVTSLAGFFIAWLLFGSSETLVKSMEMSLYRGIEVYYSNPEWRFIWDDMQYHEQCCGVQTYKDWQKTAWIEYEYEDNANNQEEPCDTKMLSLTPYSCCKLNVGCFENYIPQQTSDTGFGDLPTLNLTEINQDGCMAIIEHDYYLALYAHLLIAFLVFIFQIIILVTMRVIYLRSHNFFPLQTVNSECQTTFVVTCPKRELGKNRGQGTILCTEDDDFEIGPETRKYNRHDPERKRPGFHSMEEEDAPLLIH